ncbi:MAG: hypothetical protein WC650_02355 [Candidatus Doudnabacteria bacterium]
MKEKIKKINWFKATLAAAVLLIGFAIFYHYVIYIPNKEDLIRIEEKVDKELNKSMLEACLEDAKTTSRDQWNEYCKVDNREIGTDGSCLLASNRADDLKKAYQQIKDECFKKYPIK